jgi:release factor glutamine methyltransferase
MPTAEALLRQARGMIAHVDTPALDARLLLQHATGLAQAEVIAEPTQQVAPDLAARFLQLVERRAKSEPVSRIIGRREFYSRVFEVTPNVLDPRADTEVLIDAALARLPQDEAMRLLDLGTGSGIIAITLLAERAAASAVAVDVSSEALAVAERNAIENGVHGRTQFVIGSWFEGLQGTFDAIVSNPPYIVALDVDRLADDVKQFDPHLALDGGKDGLDCYRAIAKDAGRFLNPNGFVAVEIGAGQETDVVSIFNQNGFNCVEKQRDLAGYIRCLVFLLNS